MKPNTNIFIKAIELEKRANKIVSQIKQAEKGKRLPREEFIKLIDSRNAINTEAIEMIAVINGTLNNAKQTDKNRLSYNKYRDYCNARRIAREVLSITGYKNFSKKG